MLAGGGTKVAGNASDHPTLHTVVVVVGFAVCVALMIFIARIAAQALTDAETELTPYTPGLAT